MPCGCKNAKSAADEALEELEVSPADVSAELEAAAAALHSPSTGGKTLSPASLPRPFATCLPYFHSQESRESFS